MKKIMSLNKFMQKNVHFSCFVYNNAVIIYIRCASDVGYASDGAGLHYQPDIAQYYNESVLGSITHISCQL